MRNKLLYLIFLAVVFASCEEYYKPNLDVVDPLLVVESRLSNNPADNFVKLSMTQDFYNTTETQKVTNTKVELYQVGGPYERATETSTGYFTFKTTPVVGKKYYIRITKGSDVYESEVVTMPPLPKIDSLYTEHQVLKTYITDSYGSPSLRETQARTIYIDAPVSSTLEYYRFDYKSIIQWMYMPLSSGFPPPAYYGWKTMKDFGAFNIAGPKEFSTAEKISKHEIRSLVYDSRSYLDSTAQVPMGWILVLNQYGITKSSYDFHEQLNKQFAAEGSLFDPILTQVYGNIRCKTDPNKIALGFFDLNSYRQYRYFLYLGDSGDDNVVQRRLKRFIEIPDEGYTRGTPPTFWETIY